MSGAWLTARRDRNHIEGQASKCSFALDATVSPANLKSLIVSQNDYWLKGAV